MTPEQYPSLLDDKRPIKALCFPDGVELSIEDCNVTAITMERTPGQSAHVPCFCVWHGEHLASRWNWAHLQGVAYMDPTL